MTQGHFTIHKNFNTYTNISLVQEMNQEERNCQPPPSRENGTHFHHEVKPSQKYAPNITVTFQQGHRWDGHPSSHSEPRAADNQRNIAIRRKANQFMEKCDQSEQWPRQQKAMDPFPQLNRQDQEEQNLRRAIKRYEQECRANKKSVSDMVSESEQLVKAASNRLNQAQQSVLKKEDPPKKKKTFIKVIKTLFPCSFCAVEMALDQMEQHHNTCGMAFKCKNCHDFFPVYLFEEHPSFCPAQPRKQPRKLRSSHHHHEDRDNQGINRRKEPNNFEIQEYAMMLQEQFPEMDYRQIQAMVTSDIFEKQQPRNRHRHSHAYSQQERQFEPSEESWQGQPVFEKEKKPDRGLSEKEINRLATDTFKKGAGDKETECAICSSEKEEGDFIIRLPCFHTYHTDCVVPWLQMKSVCPTCKFNLKSK